MNKNKKPVLNIRDIVLLKQFPEEYLKKHLIIEKTHDGTSSGPIRNHLKDFIEEKTKDYIKHYQVISSNGEIIKNVKLVPEYENRPYPASTNTNGEYDFDEINDEIINTQKTGMHIITNQGFYGDYAEIGRYTLGDKTKLTIPGESEANQLLLKNDDGEYLVQSVTLVSDNGKSITLAKYNTFTDIDGESVKSILNSMNNDIKNKNKEAYLLEQKMNSSIEPLSSNPYYFKEQMENHEAAVKEIYGTDNFEEYLMDNYGQDLTYAGVKMKIQKNENVPKNNDFHHEEFYEEFESQRGHPYHVPDEDDDMYIDEDGNEWESEDEYIDAMADRADRAYDEWRDRQIGL